jgi:hypothetical protein
MRLVRIIFLYIYICLILTVFPMKKTILILSAVLIASALLATNASAQIKTGQQTSLPVGSAVESSRNASNDKTQTTRPAQNNAVQPATAQPTGDTQGGRYGEQPASKSPAADQDSSGRSGNAKAI